MPSTYITPSHPRTLTPYTNTSHTHTPSLLTPIHPHIHTLTLATLTHALTHPLTPTHAHTHTPSPAHCPPHPQVIWEYLDDGGLWQALADGDSYRIEAHYSEQSHSFHLGDAQLAFHYNLNTMMRSHPRTKHNHRIKRTIFIEERPEGGCGTLMNSDITEVGVADA